MQNIIINYEKKQKNGLILFSIPTGAGKTYQARKIIKEYIKGNILKDVPMIVYITPLKKNIDEVYEKIKEVMKDDAELLNKNLLRIYANYECVVSSLLTVEDKIQSEIKNKDSYRNLRNKINIYTKLKENSKGTQDDLSTFITEIRKEYEPKFRRDLEEEISKYAKTNKEKKVSLNHEYSWVKEIYPSCLVEDRKVLLMTMDKFLSGNDPIIGKSYSFLNYPRIKNSLVFIDEFDATKDVVLNQEIEKCFDYQLDIVRLFSIIATSLKGKKFPSQLFSGSEESKPTFEKMKSRVLEVEKQFNLDYPFKLEKADKADRCFLFDDYQLHTISSLDDGKKIDVKTDTEKNQNIISFIDQTLKNDGTFYQAIYRMKGALNYFINCCAMLAQNYLKIYNENAKKNNDDLMIMEQAISTILDPFISDKKMFDAILKMVITNTNLPKDKRFKHFLSTDFYMDGFRYYDFKDDMSHDSSTSLLMCIMDNTPEKIMLSLANKALVVGLSATCNIKTVTGNYDIEYLQNELGDDYYRLSESERKSIEEKVNKRLKGDYKINVFPEGVNDEIETVIANIFLAEKNIEKYIGLFGHDDDDFERKRLLKTILAIKEFIVNDSAKVLLVLKNQNIKLSNYGLYNLNNFKNIIEDISLENEKEVPKVFYLFGNEFESQKKEYIAEIKKGSKIILFSSYPSVGTGQNLQYEENEGEDVVEKDIDSIYVEYPRNILVTAGNIREEKNLIKYIYQMETLEKAGELSSYTATKNIKRSFKMMGNPKMSNFQNNSAYSTASVNNHVVKTLVQAVGRICRTSADKKINDVNIYVDDEIIEKINFECMKDELVNREFKEIIKMSEVKEKENLEILINLNKAVYMNDRLNQRINNTIESNFYNWNEKDMIVWKELREFVLKYPTISKKQLETIIKETGNLLLKDLYLSNYEDKLINKYQYLINFEEREKESDLPIQYYMGKIKKGYCLIDEENSRLTSFMRIPILKQEFEKKGYATCFVPNELIILPTIFQNIYKGALGEEAGRIILEQRGIKLKEIDDSSKFEAFDYQYDGCEDIYFDFKNWSEKDANYMESDDYMKYLEKINTKLSMVDGKKAFIINLLSPSFLDVHDNGNIVQIPSLLKVVNKCYYELDRNQMNTIIKKIVEVIDDGN